MNSIIKRMVIGQPEPEVGMGATILFHSDREPCTVIEVSKSKKTIIIQADIATYVANDSGLGPAQTECQEWVFEPNTKGPTNTFTLRKNGRWVQKGDDMNGTSLRLGERDKFYDPHF